MPPAARIGDMHTCPMVNPGPVPHVGGPDISGSGNVITGYMPQARVSDTLVCVPAIDKISAGSPTVLVNNLQAARIGDPTVHGGVIVAGCPTVIIGASGQGSALSGASKTGAPFCEECEKAKKAAEQAALKQAPPPNAPPADAATKPPQPTPIREALDKAYAMAEVAKKEIDAKSQKVADALGGKVAKAPIKGEKRALEKAADYAKERGASEIEPEDIFKLKDYARNTIVVAAGKEEEALKLLLEQNPDIKKYKVVEAALDECGYSGMNLTVPTSTGMLTEIQINSPHMIYAKEKPEDARRILGEEKYNELANMPGMPPGGEGHALYEVYRHADVSSEDKARAAAQSKAYYDSVRVAAGVK